MTKISVVISVYNEEKKIKACLESVKWADEIVVIDNESTDDTVQIVKKYTNHIISQKNNPQKIDTQKNIGFTKASNPWILLLDADERVTKELADEIMGKISTKVSENGFEIPRKNIIFNKWIEHSIWNPDYQLRLFRKGTGEYKDDNVHKKISVIGQIGQLENSLIHENYQSINQYMQKMLIYTDNEAKELIKDNQKFNWTEVITVPIRDFLKTFFMQRGYKDGLHGLVLSILQAFYMELVILKVWEQKGFEEVNSADFIKNVEKEFLKVSKESKYWIFSSFIDESKNTLSKIALKIKRKNL